MHAAIPVATSQVQAPPKLAAPLFPLTRPNAPRLSAYVDDLAAIEDSCWLSNYGPVNDRLEHRLVEKLFAGVGECLTVCNATIGLMIGLKLASERSRKGPYVLMPSFTFAAAAHAVLWAGLKPLLVDIEPESWTADRAQEERLLAAHGDEIAAIMPYATFGTCLDLDRYDRLSDRYDVPVVIDAAASLGSVDARGMGFGTGSRHTIIYSMHATKAFGVGEAGLVYSSDAETIALLRRMGNFGFGADRSATLPGLNSKVSEVAALSALVKLADFEAQIAHRTALAETYLQELPGWTAQRTEGRRIAYQFMPMLLPADLISARDRIRTALSSAGVGTGQYFTPHIFEQPYFRTRCAAEPLPVTEALCARIMSLPISDFMTADDVATVCQIVRGICAEILGADAVQGFRA
ncbi:aminotransferase class I/II-fold pyridoxal phosphate-dependent enzyme [Lichenifustis flavocetrariae]|uniref:DegT/DnrJ/EryC1/StrS family aminotransferase n=1 Tax=Lichenifustis flavocetrariae TaxID=2949735 RepID=A0AA42CJ39_9HYPH|nr:aminotransferase class I/II-fold pyridoxal phosphate-dependent enzyme [Lichenifustis flavocetrariae]MCW6509034.1 DegT/DnrJ/EryC1/StrS family aminotransferase [Lichenifustis flavocetrariae]